MHNFMPIARKRYSFLFQLILPFFFLCAYTPLFAKVVKRKNLKRKYDSVTVQGDLLRSFIGKPVDKLRVYGFIDGKFQPVPFQLDERDAQGNYILDKGTKNGKSGQHSALENNDELVFMAWDTGDQISAKEFPAGVQASAEIEVRDPDTGENAFVYLLLFDSPPPLSPVDYVHYDEKSGVVDAYYYAVKYSEDAPIVFDSMYTKKQIGGDGKNIIDRLKIRFWAKLVLGLRLTKNEEDFKTALLGYKDGPVRVIRSTTSELTFYGIFKSPSAVGYEYFYGNYFYIPLEINFPFDVKDVFADATVRLTTEMAPGVTGVYYNSNNTKGVTVDGKMSEEEKNINKEPFTWAVVQSNVPGNTTAFLNMPIIRENVPVKPNLYYMDDDSIPDPPEKYPGQRGNLGYELDNFQWLKKGAHRLGSVLFALPDFHLGDEVQFVNIMEKPLKVWVGKAVELPQ